MIDVKTYEENNCRKFRAQINGSVGDIFEDIRFIVRSIYDAIKESDPEDAEAFKDLVLSAINDSRFWSTENSKYESYCIDLSKIKSGGPT